MRLHNTWSFTCWLFNRLFEGVRHLYGIYDKMVCEDTGMAIMSTMMIALVSIVPMLFIFSALGIFEHVS